MTLLTLLQPASGATVDLAGVSTGTSSSSGALAVAHTLAGTSAGASSSSGALAVSHTLAGTSAGSSTSTGALSVAHALGGVSAGGSASSGLLGVSYAVAGQSVGTSSSSGSLVVLPGLRSPVFDAGSLVDLVPLTAANSEAWAHEVGVERPGRPRRVVSVRPPQVPVARLVAGGDGTVVFAGVAPGRYWIIGERDGAVRRFARRVEVGGV